MNDWRSTAVVGLCILSFIATCIIFGQTERAHDKAIFKRCDAHGGVWRILHDGGDVVGVRCQDGLTPTQ